MSDALSPSDAVPVGDGVVVGSEGQRVCRRDGGGSALCRSSARCAASTAPHSTERGVICRRQSSGPMSLGPVSKMLYPESASKSQRAPPHCAEQTL